MNDKYKKEASRIRRENASKSLYAFAKTYLAHHLKSKPSNAHLEIYDKLLNMTIVRAIKYVLAAPREFGKSTTITLVFILYCVCYQKERFIFVVSNTVKLATWILDAIKFELLNNPLLGEDFPELFEFKGEPNPPRWTKYEVETRTGIKVMVMGVGQSCRGVRYQQHRPTLIIGDDLEKGNAYSSIETLEKAKDWFRKSILRLGSQDTNFIILGTYFHPYCLIGELLDDEKSPDWEKGRYRAMLFFPVNGELWEKHENIFYFREEHEGQTGPEAAKKFYDANASAMDNGAVSLWPEKWDIYYLMKEKVIDPVVFSSEFQNVPADPKMLPFAMQELEFWTDEFKSVEDLQKFVGDDYGIFGACDPSMGKGDYSAIVVILKDHKTNTSYVIHADIRRRSVHDTISDIVALAIKYSFTKFVVEGNNFQELMCDQLRDRCRKEGVSLFLDVVKNTTHKEERIRAMQSVTRSKELKFNKNHHLLLEQLCFFPMHSHDDGPDALQMVVEASRGLQKVQVMIIESKDDWWGDYKRNLGWRW